MSTWGSSVVKQTAFAKLKHLKVACPQCLNCVPDLTRRPYLQPYLHSGAEVSPFTSIVRRYVLKTCLLLKKGLMPIGMAWFCICQICGNCPLARSGDA